MDLAIIYGRLRPSYKGKGCFYDDSFTWLDDRPQPTTEECEAEQAVMDEEQAASDNASAAAATYYGALAAGYLHTDGYTYYCDERATTDMVKALTLFGLNADEPLPVLDMDGGVHPLMIDDFRILAEAVGRYQYGLRLAYWSNLGAV